MIQRLLPKRTFAEKHFLHMFQRLAMLELSQHNYVSCDPPICLWHRNMKLSFNFPTIHKWSFNPRPHGKDSDLAKVTRA